MIILYYTTSRSNQIESMPISQNELYDFFWSLCYGAGAVKAALETQSIGIEKIPTKSQIDENVSYLFSRV
jgi:hypothetical protein